ncbi:MAG: reductive dehalogenase [Acidobacteria bacterium]|nr:reductive dehalogenase [Acidobacteriota bacterium]MBF85766.1 reductive dehalogenase [Acidobacteriota bacterium]MEC7769143.1 reductive dehalogenase [Acidobacteriota bacterium]|tara:strand:- start:1128 stop:2312 length:1185 start_codon:yes stop_codon:yes gene_type:complete
MSRPTPDPDRNAQDTEAGFDIQPDFERFHQRDEVFRRSWWDARIRSPKSELFYATHREPLKSWRPTDGFTQKDYALRNAAWHVSDLFTDLKQDADRREGFNDEFTLTRGVAAERMDLGTPVETAAEIKRVAKGFGADLVGITDYDERWMYAKKFSDLTLVDRPQEIPAEVTNVIVTAQSMDYDLIRTVPSALSGAATGAGYSRDAMVVLSIAQYIQNLGYQAVASMNDTSLAIPFAIKAGLGEYGRHGLLITKEFGPRVRLGKIYTDLPLAHDQPIRFGVKEFCDVCRRCSAGCPVQAIPDGVPSTVRYNQSNIKGVRKWSVDGEKCFGYWAAQNSDCSICIRVCPYNKDFSKWWLRVGRWLAGTRLRRLMLWLDMRLGYGERMDPKRWWSARA